MRDWRGFEMVDEKGKLIRVGDRLNIAPGLEGTVVFSIDTDEFSPEFPKSDWAYLGRGIMVRTEQAGLVYLEKPLQHIEIIE